MDQQEIIAEIEGRAVKLGVPISRLCEQAGIHPTTFSRWKLSDKNPDPIGATLKSLHALTNALDELERREAA
jgi:hypothetical protein